MKGKRRGRPVKKKSKARRRRESRMNKRLILQSVIQIGSQGSLSRHESIIRNRNKLNYDNGSDWRASEIWNLGRLIGILGKEDDNEVINKLMEMEARDKGEQNGQKKQHKFDGDMPAAR